MKKIGNCMRNGFGIDYYEDGSFYKGKFSKGRKNGIHMKIYNFGQNNIYWKIELY